MVDSAGSVGGGGKFKQVIKDIVNAERQPIRLLEARKAKENERLKLSQEFIAKVRKIPEAYKELDNLRKFRELRADWPAKDLMDVSLDKLVAETGEYQIEIKQLAGRRSMISNGYESPEDEIGVGFFKYILPSGESKSVFLGPGDDTVRGLVRAINSEKGLGVQASLVNDGSDSGTPWRVVVATRKGGMDNDAEFPAFYFLDGDLRFLSEDERSAQNAIIGFNGFEIMSQANRFELLSGVSVELKQDKEDYEFTLTITEDIPKIAAKIKALVDAINGTLDFIVKQNKLDANSDTSRTLGGDTALFTIESRLRYLMFNVFNVDPDDEDIVRRVSDVGIRFEKGGVLSFDEAKFTKEAQANFDYVANLFAGEENFIDNLKFVTEGFLIPEKGGVTVREKGIRDRIKAIDNDIARKEMHIQRREEQLKRQFSQLEGLMGNMQGQQMYLQQAAAGMAAPQG